MVLRVSYDDRASGVGADRIESPSLSSEYRKL